MRNILGIDVSENNEYINWDAVKESGVEFAYIRVGYGSDILSQDDKQAERNMCECKRLGIPYGVYLYSYALTTVEVESEYRHFKRVIGSHNPILGVAYDMEDADGYKEEHGLKPYNNGELLTEFCSIFASMSEREGYLPITYANKDYFSNVINKNKIKGYKWLASWYKCNGAENHPGDGEIIWQFSSDVDVDGNGSSRMDMNYFIDEELFDSLTS